MEKRTNLTKDVLRSFITSSAKFFNLSESTYLENRAQHNYLVMEGYRPILWEDGSLMVLNTRNLAEDEAREYENGRVVNEYDYYVSRGVFKEAE